MKQLHQQLEDSVNHDSDLVFRQQMSGGEKRLIIGRQHPSRWMGKFGPRF